jgi:transposase
MKTEEVVYIGIDVSKETLDIDAGDLGAWKIRNTPAETRKTLSGVARKADGAKPLQACFESTGPYTGALASECRKAGIAYSVLNPYKVRHFAKSVSEAKTDAIDACLIRRYSEVRRPETVPKPNKALEALDGLLLARDSIVKSVTALRSVLETVGSSPGARLMRRAIASLEKKAADYDRLIAETVKADDETAGLVGALCTVKGVGTLTAAKVAAGMPEIGRLGRRKAAALAGLAPHTRESGKYKGRSRIGGGRKRVRDALFMPATVAIRFDAKMKSLHERDMAKGKPYMVAVTAAMRRLICHLESVAKDYYARCNAMPT